MIYLAAPAVCLATQATAAEFAAKLDADRATLGDLATELFLPWASR
jgi:hypothetical protein